MSKHIENEFTDFYQAFNDTSAASFPDYHQFVSREILTKIRSEFLITIQFSVTLMLPDFWKMFQK